MYVCMYIRIHKQYVHTHTHTQTCMYVCMYACMYLCMLYIYIYIYTYTHTHTYIHIYLFRLEQRGNSRVRRLQERGVAHHENKNAVFGDMWPRALVSGSQHTPGRTRQTRTPAHTQAPGARKKGKTLINTPAIGEHVVEHTLARAGEEGAKVLCRVLFTGGSPTH